MRDAARELPHRFHALRLSELLLHPAALTQVARGEDGNRLASLVERRLGDDLKWLPGSVPVAKAKLDRAGRRPAGEHGLHGNPRCGEVVGMDELEDLPADEPLAAVLQDPLN